MIKDLRRHLESTLGIPVHYVAINETERRPCAAIRQSLFDSHQALQKANGFAVTGLQLNLYGEDYERLLDLTDEIRKHYDGSRIPLIKGGRSVKLTLEDIDDDALPGEDGSDDWIYVRQINFRIHHKLKG